MPITSPLLSHYRALEREHPGALVLIKLGDFYEAFGTAAGQIAKSLKITLTKRTMVDGTVVPMAGIPYHCLHASVRQLAQAGCIVVVAEPIERTDPSKGVAVVPI